MTKPDINKNIIKSMFLSLESEVVKSWLEMKFKFSQNAIKDNK